MGSIPTFGISDPLLGFRKLPSVTGRLVGLTVVLVLAVGCGGTHGQPRDGAWYGRLGAISVQDRTLSFAPACRLGKTHRWLAIPAGDRRPFTISLASRARLEIYYRPRGDPAAGHGQPSELGQIADAASKGPPDFPPGWFLTVDGNRAVAVTEDSGITSSGQLDRRTHACVWSRSTRLFVSRQSP